MNLDSCEFLKIVQNHTAVWNWIFGGKKVVWEIPVWKKIRPLVNNFNGTIYRKHKNEKWQHFENSIVKKTNHSQNCPKRCTIKVTSIVWNLDTKLYYKFKLVVKFFLTYNFTREGWVSSPLPMITMLFNFTDPVKLKIN